jgi:hypothetical protein
MEKKMNNKNISHDERTETVENASYRIAYLVMSFGLLASVAYRGFILQQNSWDLLALVILGGATATLYQGIGKVLSQRWIKISVATIIISGILGALLVLFFRWI